MPENVKVHAALLGASALLAAMSLYGFWFHSHCFSAPLLETPALCMGWLAR